VRVAINFYDQHPRDPAGEIDDVPADDDLLPEFAPLKRLARSAYQTLFSNGVGSRRMAFALSIRIPSLATTPPLPDPLP